MSSLEEVYMIARAQTLIALCSTVPGYWFTVALIDRTRRFTIQLMGFFFMTVFMFALAIPYHHWTMNGNQIGFVVCHVFIDILLCISAAAGKARAMVGAFGFLYAQNAIGVRNVLLLLGVANFLGMMFTFLVPESKGKSLEEISGEAEEETTANRESALEAGFQV